jgi:hypothetical protein
MSNIEKIAGLCDAAITKVDDAIASHERGEPADLSIPMLQKVKTELVKMRENLKPSVFKPSYPRFVLDWPDEHGLVAYLSEVAYQYSRIKS